MRSTLKRTNLLERRRSSGIAHLITIADGQSLLELVVPLALFELLVELLVELLALGVDVEGVGAVLVLVEEVDSLFALGLLRESVL